MNDVWKPIAGFEGLYEVAPFKGRYHDMILRKCTVYGATHIEASDWRKKYVACGLFCKEWSGTEIIRTLRYSGMPKQPEQPLDGQMDLLKQEATE